MGLTVRSNILCMHCSYNVIVDVMEDSHLCYTDIIYMCHYSQTPCSPTHLTHLLPYQALPYRYGLHNRMQ